MGVVGVSFGGGVEILVCKVTLELATEGGFQSCRDFGAAMTDESTYADFDVTVGVDDYVDFFAVWWHWVFLLEQIFHLQWKSVCFDNLHAFRDSPK